MIPEADIWRAVLLMCKRYGADALLGAAARPDQLLEVVGRIRPGLLYMGEQTGR